MSSRLPQVQGAGDGEVWLAVYTYFRRHGRTWIVCGLQVGGNIVCYQT
ncbi:MAG: hypothetical protein VX405_06880 [Myxococcota bacterium]|nr:hypothetical protein [Myxococcota bacterium]